MKTKVAGAALMAVLMSIGSLAVAQDRDRDRDRDHRGGPPDRQDHRDGPQDRNRDRDARRDDNRGPQGRDGRGAGPEHNFYRGGRLPSSYRSRQYVVDDWRGHRLSAPPRGYHWVQTGGDYVLAAIATGVILQVLINQ